MPSLHPEQHALVGVAACVCGTETPCICETEPECGAVWPIQTAMAVPFPQVDDLRRRFQAAASETFAGLGGESVIRRLLRLRRVVCVLAECTPSAYNI